MTIHGKNGNTGQLKYKWEGLSTFFEVESAVSAVVSSRHDGAAALMSI